MIELYHSPDTRSFRALWTLEEMGMQYQLHLLPFPPRVLAPEYLKVNPLGTIPLLIDGTVRLSESAAIVQYLVTRYGPSPLAVDASEADYGAWLNWLHFGEATLTFPQTLVLRYRRLEPGRAPMVADDYARWFLSRLKHVDRVGGSRLALCRKVYRCRHLGRIRATARGFSWLVARSRAIDPRLLGADQVA